MGGGAVGVFGEVAECDSEVDSRGLAHACKLSAADDSDDGEPSGGVVRFEVPGCWLVHEAEPSCSGAWGGGAGVCALGCGGLVGGDCLEEEGEGGGFGAKEFESAAVSFGEGSGYG